MYTLTLNSLESLSQFSQILIFNSTVFVIFSYGAHLAALRDQKDTHDYGKLAGNKEAYFGNQLIFRLVKRSTQHYIYLYMIAIDFGSGN